MAELDGLYGTTNGSYVDADGKERAPTSAEMTTITAEMELFSV